MSNDHIKLSDLQRQMFRAADKTGSLTVNVWDASVILRCAARRLNSLSVSQCNGIERYDSKLGRCISQWNDTDQENHDRLRDKAIARVKAAMVLAYGDDWGLFYFVEFQDDPRGAPIKVHSAIDLSRSFFSVW